MDNFRVVGVGCFGKPETVTRMFTKKVRIYAPEKDIEPESRSISGFYLGEDDQALKLSLFSRRSGHNMVVNNFSLILEPKLWFG
jgi:hypothetical protein